MIRGRAGRVKMQGQEGWEGKERQGKKEGQKG
jgi:hypothetical protein